MKNIYLLIFFFLCIYSNIDAQETMTSQDSIQAGLKAKMPQFIGGQEGLVTFLRTTVKYPEDAVKENIKGRVLVEFMITKTGKVTNVRILESLSPSCDDEAVRVVSSMPDWIPGEYKGKIVDVIFKIPIVFSANR